MKSSILRTFERDWEGLAEWAGFASEKLVLMKQAGISAITRRLNRYVPLRPAVETRLFRFANFSTLTLIPAGLSTARPCQGGTYQQDPKAEA